MYHLENKVVVITGASSGIGLATATAFAHEKTRLMLAARRADRLAKACAEARQLGSEAQYKVTDVSREEEVKQLIKQTIASYGRIDILVNNAGYGYFLPLAETSATDLHNLMNVNFFGTFYAIHAALPIMLEQNSGHIISVSSVAGKRVFRGGGGAYNASKFAMQGLTEALRMELIDTGIKVSAVCPVVTATEFFDPVEKQTGRKAKLYGPIQTAQQVARAIVALAHRPQPEVIMVKPLRILLMLNALFPGLVDRLIMRFLKN